MVRVLVPKYQEKMYRILSSMIKSLTIYGYFTTISINKYTYLKVRLEERIALYAKRDPHFQ